jgi:hypothetical protein
MMLDSSLAALVPAICVTLAALAAMMNACRLVCWASSV